jgi:hypothetical protein
MLALLEAAHLGRRGRLDLASGAIDARIHSASRLAAVASFVAGLIWTVAGTWVVVQPGPPDWPGYATEVLLPVIVAVAAGGLGLLGAWAVGSDASGRVGTIAVGLAIAGHMAWLGVLVAALVGAEYGSVTAAGQALGAIGCMLVGLALVRGREARFGVVLVIAPTGLLFGWPIAWITFGFAWTLIGFLLLAELAEERSPPSPVG